MENIYAIFSDDAHLVSNSLLDFLVGSPIVIAHVTRLLYNLSIFKELVAIGVNVVPQGLLGVLPAGPEAKLDPAKKLSIDPKFFANKLVELLLT